MWNQNMDDLEWKCYLQVHSSQEPRWCQSIDQQLKCTVERKIKCQHVQREREREREKGERGRPCSTHISLIIARQDIAQLLHCTLHLVLKHKKETWTLQHSLYRYSSLLYTIPVKSTLANVLLYQYMHVTVCSLQLSCYPRMAWQRSPRVHKGRTAIA